MKKIYNVLFIIIFVFAAPACKREELKVQDAAAEDTLKLDYQRENVEITRNISKLAQDSDGRYYELARWKLKGELPGNLLVGINKSGFDHFYASNSLPSRESKIKKHFESEGVLAIGTDDLGENKLGPIFYTRFVLDGGHCIYFQQITGDTEIYGGLDAITSSTAALTPESLGIGGTHQVTGVYCSEEGDRRSSEELDAVFSGISIAGVTR